MSCELVHEKNILSSCEHYRDIQPMETTFLTAGLYSLDDFFPGGLMIGVQGNLQPGGCFKAAPYHGQL